MSILISPVFWIVVTLVGFGLLALCATTMKDLLNNTTVAVIISMMIALGYFHLVNHYLMDMQGLDYWYLFRE